MSNEEEVKEAALKKYPLSNIEGNWLDVPQEYKQEGFIEGWKSAIEWQKQRVEKEVPEEKDIAEKARDHANEVERFFSPTIEAYRLRAKNSFQEGYTQALLNEKQALDINNLLKEIEKILEGIDQYEEDGAWWENNVSAEFGKSKLDAVKKAVLEHFKEVPDITVYRWVKASENPPPDRERISVKLDGKFLTGGKRIGDVICLDSTNETFTEKSYQIEWLEPTSLKSLLQTLN